MLSVHFLRSQRPVLGQGFGQQLRIQMLALAQLVEVQLSVLFQTLIHQMLEDPQPLEELQQELVSQIERVQLV